MSLSDKIDDRNERLLVRDVKEFIDKIKSPILSELKVIKGFDNRVTQTVRILLTGILKKINKEAGDKFV